MAISCQRKIVLPSGQWTYRVGKTMVRFTPPDGRSFAVGTDVVTGRTPDMLARGRAKSSSDGMVTPADVRKYITELLAI